MASQQKRSIYRSLEFVWGARVKLDDNLMISGIKVFVLPMFVVCE